MTSRSKSGKVLGIMESRKRKKLESKGWKVGSAEEFLELSPAESEYVELKIRLSSALKQIRERRGLTQTVAAKRLNSSQSRVAKMEAADETVSVDLLINALLGL